MAEAHSAVAFSFAITHDGWDVNFDREVLYLVWESGVRSWKKRIARFRNSVQNGVYPAHLQSLWAVWGVLVLLHFSGYTAPFNLVNRMITYLPGSSLVWQLTGCALAALILWLMVIFILRYSLKILFMYKGWMYESKGPKSKISLQTKLWLVAVKLLSGWNNPRLYSFQGSLPRLPLPSVEETMKRYLRSVRPLLDDTNYNRMEKLAEEFQKGIAVKLQNYLRLKSWWSSNYVSDWWEEYVYLRGRSPLMINSNFYGIDALMMKTSTIQSARAANVIYHCLVFRRMIERQELEPIMVQKMVPLCSWQYERIFNTVRVPGVETDKIVHYQDSNHVVVYHKGRYFKVIIYSRGRLLKPAEIQIQMEAILNDTSAPEEGEEIVASLTAGERSHWAHTRCTLFNKGHNRTSLHLIETAAFAVTLDDFPYEFDDENHSKLDKYGRILLHGKGYDRWFDKSFTLCIGTNGRCGFNAEHTWYVKVKYGHENIENTIYTMFHRKFFINNMIRFVRALFVRGDAGVMSHVWEIVIMDDIIKKLADAPVMGHCWENVISSEKELGYDEKGNALGEVTVKPPMPTRLKWDLKSQEYKDAVKISHDTAQKLVNDLDLRIFMFSSYGKGFMKKCRISPDAYIQMALQLAYYRNAGRFSLTYEASMTRLFREGRTETVRPCTIESSAWVKAMDNDSVSLAEKWKLFQAATAQHQLGYQDAMCGKGIDRHLFCLYVVCKYLELDSPFLQEVLSEPWRLSTSQTPHGQTSKMDLKKYPECISAGGGFGPVADDGYGVSYIIAGEDVVFFHISSKKCSPITDSSKFASDVELALENMKTLFENYSKSLKN